MKIFFLFIFFFTSFFYSYSQAPSTSARPPADSLKVVQILSAERYGYKKLDSIRELLLLVHNVALKQDNTIFYADSAVYNKDAKIVEAFGNVHINDNDSIDTYSDYLLYHVDTKMATLTNKVRLTDGKSNLYTEHLEYDVNQKIGVYHNGGRVVNESSVLTSEEGTYYADLKDVYFMGDVKLKDPKYNLASDSLLYNTTTQIATFIAKTFIEDSAKRTVVTSDGYYDLKNRNASFGKRPVIRDGAVIIIADDVQTDDVTGVSILTGKAVFKDTAQGLSVLANSIVSNRTEGSILATQKPLMIIKQDRDSLYLTADTLFSGRLSMLEVPVDSTTAIDSSAIAAASNDSAKIKADLSPSTEPKANKIQDSTRNAVALSPARDSITTNRTLDAIADSLARMTADSTRNMAFIEPAGIIEKDSQALSKNIPRIDADIKDKSSSKDSVNNPSTIAAGKKEIAVRPALAKNKKDNSAPKTSVATTPADANNKIAAKPVTAKIIRPAKDTTIALASGSSPNDSTDRFFRAYRHVRIFSDSLQAMADSLFYSGKDSIFRLFRDPIVWASASQVTGDTIYLYTKNKKPDQMYVFENGMIINKSGDNMFNQIRGNRLNGYFHDGEIDYMRSRGNAESVYYVKDNEDKLVGINKATADIIDMRFRAKELQRVVFISEAKGTMFPINQVSEEDKTLRNFKWQEDKRPKTKFELFGD